MNEPESRTALIAAATLGLLVVIALGVVVALVLISFGHVTGTRLFIASALAGAAGGSVESARRVGTLIRNLAYSREYTYYFAARPALGAAFGVLLYLVVSGGIVASGAPPSSFNYVGVVVVSFLGGIYSRNLGPLFARAVDIILGPGSESPSGGPYISRPLPSARRLLRYSGFFVCQLTPLGEGRHIINVRVQREPPIDDALSVEVDVGEGVPARRVTFVASVFPEEGEVEPRSAEIVARSTERFGEGADFLLVAPPDAVPQVVVEVAQRGRLVAAARIGPDSDDAENY